MKNARTAFVLASLAGFLFGIVNGCGTEPISPRRKALSVANSGAAGDESSETSGTPIVDMGSTGAAGTAVAGGVAGGTGGSPGASGSNGGAAGTDLTGSSGSGGSPSGGGMSGAGGSNGGASGAGGSNGGESGAGGSTGGAAGAGGSGGSPPTGCNNATVVDAAGSATKCPATGTWTVSAMPVPPHNFMQIPDTKLQPQYAVDGSTTTRYSTGAKSAGGEWFRVDLGATTQITGVVLDDSVSVNDMPYGYKVEVSTDGTAWTQVATCNALPAGTTETINFAAKSGRYVRVSVTAPGIHWWSIDELGVLCK